MIRGSSSLKQPGSQDRVLFYSGLFLLMWLALLLIMATSVAGAHVSALLQRHGLLERDVCGDGNCQFRAISDQLFGSEAEHVLVRNRVAEELRANPGTYSGFIFHTDYETYVAEVARPGSWGDHLTLQAAANAFGFRCHVVSEALPDDFWEIVPVDVLVPTVVLLVHWPEVHYSSVQRRCSSVA